LKPKIEGEIFIKHPLTLASPVKKRQKKTGSILMADFGDLVVFIPAI